MPPTRITLRSSYPSLGSTNSLPWTAVHNNGVRTFAQLVLLALFEAFPLDDGADGDGDGAGESSLWRRAHGRKPG